MLVISRAVDLPDPEVNARVPRYEADLLWRDKRLIVETDGFGAHRSKRAFEHDRRRDVDLALAGYAVHRFTHDQVMREPEETGRRLPCSRRSVEDRARPVARDRLVARRLAAVPEPAVEDARRDAEPLRDQLAGVHRARPDLALLARPAAAARPRRCARPAPRRSAARRRRAARGARGCRRRSSAGRGRRSRHAGQRQVVRQDLRPLEEAGVVEERHPGGSIEASRSADRRPRPPASSGCARPGSRRVAQRLARRAPSARAPAPGRARGDVGRVRARSSAADHGPPRGSGPPAPTPR